MTDVAPGIITFGLGGDHSNMIVGNIFNLGFFEVEVIVTPPPTGGQGGGSIPFLPGRIKDFYRPVDNKWQVPYLYPRDRRVPVTIRITFMGKTIEKNYKVQPKRSDIIITVLNMINTIKSRISVTVKNIRRVPSRIVAYVKNLRHKDEE